MAPTRISSFEASHTTQRDLESNDTQFLPFNIPCAGLSSQTLDSWLQREQKSSLELLQAAWALCLRSYTGSDDVWFSSLHPKQNYHCHVSPSTTTRSLFEKNLAEATESHSSTCLGAKCVVYDNEARQNTQDSVTSSDLKEFDYALCLSKGTAAKRPAVGFLHKHSVISTELATMIATTVAKAIEEIICHTDSLLETLDICSDADINRLYQWNKTAPGGATPPQCIHHMISQRCTSQPEATAVSAWDGQFTYAELDSLSSALAVQLQHNGVGPETFVPMVFDKSRWAVVALLGVLKAGGAYFFVNPAFPVQYSRSLCSSLDPKLALCSPSHSKLAKSLTSEVLVVGEGLLELSIARQVGEQTLVTPSRTDTSNAMYITFTSGTTGKPKGIITEHAAFHSMAVAIGAALQVSPETKMLQFASYTFDVSNRDHLVTLMFGGCVCIPSEDDRLNDLSGFINRHSVNLASLTPSLASTLTPASCPTLRGLVLGGEPMGNSHIATWSKHVRLFNAYGVSESAGIASLASNIQEGYSSGNIGYGSGSTLWVVSIDQRDRLAPIGAMGELVIEGPAVSRGYMGEKERTEKQFTASPGWRKRIQGRFGENQSWSRAFHTGDLVRYNLDGSLTFLGRKDHQIKINGQRLELPAIEHHIATCGEVIKSGFLHVCVVAVKDAVNNPTKLFAFLGHDTSREPETPSQILERRQSGVENLRAALVEHLLRDLPKFMVPADFTFLEHVPLTTSGKIHRLLLQDAAVQLRDQMKNSGALDLDRSQVAATPKEKLLAQSWASALGITETSIGRNDCFFQRGGDSIAAIKMSSGLREKGFVLSVSTIFKFSKLSAMASMIVEDGKTLSSHPAPFSLINDRGAIIEAVSSQFDLSADQIEDVYPATHIQQGLIALTAQDPHAYLASFTWPLTPSLDVARFKDAWKAAWVQNPILRTRVVQVPEGIFQVVVKTEMPLNTVTATGMTKEELVPINIEQGPLVQFYLSREEFRVDIHHALFDEWSLSLVMAQVERAYRGEKLNVQPFSPFVHHLLQQRDAEIQEFWHREFEGLQAEHFPISASKPADDGPETKTEVLEHELRFDGEIPTKYTLSSILRLAWAIVLWHRTGSSDVMFGATVSGRNASVAGIDQMSGPTLATLPVRINLSTNQSVQVALSQIQDQFANMMGYEQTGLTRIRRVGKEAAEACNFQNLLVVQPPEQHTDSRMFDGPNGLTPVSDNVKAYASYPFVLICRLERGGVSFKGAFDPLTLTASATHGILRQLSHVVQQLITSDSITLESVNMVPPEDMDLLKKWNAVLPKAVDTSIHDRIRQLCHEHPDKLAVHSEDLNLTYGQLEHYSNQFAERLSSAGIKRGDFVPLLLHRSPWVPVIVLAVLKVGAAFVLLDLSHPVKRLQTMCAKVDAKVIVSVKEHTQTSDSLLLPVILFDSSALNHSLSGNKVAPAPESATVATTVDSPACVVFSSGSTGLPKGIVLSHGAIATSATVMRDHGMLHPNSRVFHFASFAFDISIGEILFTLSAGACVCVPNEEERRGNPAKAAGDLKVTWALLTPSVINLFEPSDVPTLEVLGSAGEPLTQSLVDMWAHRVKLYGMYAPAECTVISHITPIFPSTACTNVGWSFGASTWVADPSNHNRLVPIGTVGELIVEGPVVSSGYINDPEKTSAVFITSPSWLAEVRSESGRMYKTGDLVRQNKDGSLIFLGRKDDQVKLHGQRLEVGEIEHCITSSHAAIRTSAVECIKIAEQNNRVCLIAFVCPQVPGEWGQLLDTESATNGDLKLIGPASESFTDVAQELEASLRELLPAYMVPSFYVPLEDVPLSLSGKINRRMLREQTANWPLKKLEEYQLKRTIAVDEEVPITARGRALQEIVGEALNVEAESIPMNGNFFSIGGDSISAMRVSMLARRKGLRLTVADIFTHQILFKMAEACVEEDDGAGNVTKKSASATRSPHHCEIALDKLPKRLPQKLAKDVVEALPATEFQVMTLYNFYNRYLWIPLPKAVDQGKLLRACEQLVQKHSILRSVFCTNDDKSVVQLTLRQIPVSFVRHSGIEDLEKHCNDDSLAMGVPVNGEIGFQAQLVTLKSSESILVLRMPHALFDGLSLATICSDISDAYCGHQLPPAAQFSDHIRQVWDKRTPETYNIWREALEGASMTSMRHKFMANWESPLEHEGAKMGANVQQPSGVTAIAETLPVSPPPGVTLATLVKLAWAITLSHLFTSGEGEEAQGKQGLTDVVFGQVVHGRGLGIAHEDRIIGPCINIIPVRVHLPPGSDKFELLDQVQRQHIQTMGVENLGLGEITQHCTPWAPGTKFGSFVRFQNFSGGDEASCTFDDGLPRETNLYSLPNMPSATANVLVVPRGNTLSIAMTVSSAVLDAQAADYVVGYFSDVIGGLASEEAGCEYL